MPSIRKESYIDYYSQSRNSSHFVEWLWSNEEHDERSKQLFGEAAVAPPAAEDIKDSDTEDTDAANFVEGSSSVTPWPSPCPMPWESSSTVMPAGSNEANMSRLLPLPKLQDLRDAITVQQPKDGSEYDLLDDYIDDVLGTPAEDRPAHWKRPELAETEPRLTRFDSLTSEDDPSATPATQVAVRRRSGSADSDASSIVFVQSFDRMMEGWASIDSGVIGERGKDPATGPATVKSVEAI